jgi:hypothetical protein
MATWAVKSKGRSIRRACELFGVSQTCYRYKPKLSGQNDQIADWLLRLTVIGNPIIPTCGNPKVPTHHSEETQDGSGSAAQHGMDGWRRAPAGALRPFGV